MGKKTMGEHLGLAQHFTCTGHCSFLSRARIFSRSTRTKHLIELEAGENGKEGEEHLIFLSKTRAQPSSSTG